MKYKLVFTELSRSDYAALDGSQKTQVLKSLTKIEKNGMDAGTPLHGKLWDCRKLKHRKLGLRVIFRQSEAGLEIIEIVVIGKRKDDEAYEPDDNMYNYWREFSSNCNSSARYPSLRQCISDIPSRISI